MRSDRPAPAAEGDSALPATFATAVVLACPRALTSRRRRETRRGPAAMSSNKAAPHAPPVDRRGWFARIDRTALVAVSAAVIALVVGVAALGQAKEIAVPTVLAAIALGAPGATARARPVAGLARRRADRCRPAGRRRRHGLCPRALGHVLERPRAADPAQHRTQGAPDQPRGPEVGRGRGAIGCAARGGGRPGRRPRARPGRRRRRSRRAGGRRPRERPPG